MAPLTCAVLYAVGTGLDMAERLRIGPGLGAALVFFVGRSWVMATLYFMATVPSFLAWGVTVRLARLSDLAPDAAMRIAASVTALVASALLLVWFRDEGYRAMVPAIAFVAVLVLFLVAERIIRSHSVRRGP